jgi:DNA polymerase III subunit epsilon
MNVVDKWLRQMGALAGRSAYHPKGSRNAEAVAYARRLQREQKQRDHLEMPFKKLPVVVFDIETTGFSPKKGDTVLSIGAVKQKETGLEEFYSLVYSETEPSETVKELTGITGNMLLEAPPAEEVFTDFLQFIQGHTLVAHHAKHEKAFMEQTLWTLYRMKFDYRLLDTTFLTKIIDPERQLHSLEECCDYFNIPSSGRHHALEDAKMTYRLWTTCAEQVQKQGFHTLKDVYSMLARQQH